jgi:hypothetical protein
MAKRRQTEYERFAEHGFNVVALEGAIMKALPLHIDKMPAGFESLSWTELFASKRAATLPPEVVALWDALCSLETRLIYPPYEVKDKNLTKAEYEKHMARRIAAANEGY